MKRGQQEPNRCVLSSSNPAHAPTRLLRAMASCSALSLTLLLAACWTARTVTDVSGTPVTLLAPGEPGTIDVQVVALPAWHDLRPDFEMELHRPLLDESTLNRWGPLAAGDLRPEQTGHTDMTSLLAREFAASGHCAPQSTTAIRYYVAGYLTTTAPDLGSLDAFLLAVGFYVPVPVVMAEYEMRLFIAVYDGNRRLLGTDVFHLVGDRWSIWSWGQMMMSSPGLQTVHDVILHFIESREWERRAVR